MDAAGVAISTAVVLLAVAAYAAVTALRALPPRQEGVVAFFHPFADGGGGGERVLWCAVQALQQALPDVEVAIYVRHGVTARQLAQDAARRFNIDLPRPVKVVPLKRTRLIEADAYSWFTLLGQAWGAARLGWEALSQLVPEVFVDTTGWAPTYPLARAAGARVAAYVHYPTISADMLGRVWAREASYNNAPGIAGSGLRSLAKLAYYHVFALAYGLAGSFAEVVMVNSSWTAAHIRSLWRGAPPPALLHPPCDTEDLQRLPLDRRLKHLYLVSVAQFRPEKDHELQLEAYALARRQAGEDAAGQAIRVSSLQVVGSCRGPDDEARLAGLKALAEELGIGEAVAWHENVPYSELRQLLGGAVGGLHTMRDEHFGISVVEYMAAGVIPIAHNSAGPRMDIVVPKEAPEGPQPTGYLAETAEEYAEAIAKVLAMDQRDRLHIAATARRRAARFSVERFQRGFVEAMLPLLPG